jgi:GTP cyclohydrolase I
MIDREKAAEAIESFLRALDLKPEEDPELRGTGRRVAEAFADELLRGYRIDARAALRRHLVGASTGLIVVRDIAVATMCPHHLLPAQGKATIAFAPNANAVGLGAVVALVDDLARRLVLQETLGEDIAGALFEELGARWVACRLVLAHGCMTARGERAHGTTVETLASRGLEDPRHRSEALRIVSANP